MITQRGREGGEKEGERGEREEIEEGGERRKRGEREGYTCVNPTSSSLFILVIITNRSFESILESCDSDGLVSFVDRYVACRFERPLKSDPGS